MTVRPPEHDELSPGGARHFLLWRALPVLVGLIVLFLAASALMVWSTQAVDRVAAAREMRLFESGALGLRDRVAHDQESVTVWDDAIRYLAHDNAESRRWIESNLLVWMNDYFDHDEIYLLDAQNRPIHAFSGGEFGVPGQFDGARAVVLPLVDRLRARLAAGDETGLSKRVLTIGESDFGIVGGRPAIVSVKPMVPSMDSLVAPPAPPAGANILHVSIVYLDGSVLSRLARIQGLGDLRFVQGSDVEMAHGDGTFELRDRQGNAIGTFLWSSFHPGDTVLDQTGPIFLGICAALLVGAGVALLLIYRRTRGEQAARREAQRLALYDSVTGLPNRGLLNRVLARALAALPADGPLGALYIDLERFRLVNETLGRDTGNAILTAFARRLEERLLPGEMVARVGGDEFLLLTRGRGDSEVRALAEAILAGARVPFVVDESPVLIGLFVGYVLVDAPGISAAECVRRADVARFHARATGRARCAAFGPDMDRYLKHRRETEQDLHRALAAQSWEITAFFQPVFSLIDGHVTGAEALVRWKHPVRGWIPPDDFIPIAEEAELIGLLGNRVLRAACREAARWPGQTVAVNASPRELSDPDYPLRVAEALAASGLAPSRLNIEVTETAMLESAGQTERTLAALRGLGVGVVLDDFGTGFSSLSRLRKLDVGRIKIDRSFITHICENATDRAIVQAIVDMAHAAGLKTTVEGVETADQADLLRTMGCDDVQGFFFSRPLPACDVEPLMGALAGQRRAAALSAGPC